MLKKCPVVEDRSTYIMSTREVNVDLFAWLMLHRAAAVDLAELAPARDEWQKGDEGDATTYLSTAAGLV